MMIWNNYSGELNYQEIWLTSKRIFRRMVWNLQQTLRRGEPKRRFTASPTSPSKRRRNMKSARGQSWLILIFLSCSKISADNGLLRCQSSLKFLMMASSFRSGSVDGGYQISVIQLDFNTAQVFKVQFLLAYIMYRERQITILSMPSNTKQGKSIVALFWLNWESIFIEYYVL